MNKQLSRGSAGYYQADEKAGVAWLRWRYQADDKAGSRGSVGDYQADEQAGVTRLIC